MSGDPIAIAVVVGAFAVAGVVVWASFSVATGRIEAMLREVG